MGTVYSAYIGSPDTTPNRLETPSFDSSYGFPTGRKQREMKVTEEEMEAAGLDLDQRDYCAHHLIDFLKCSRENFPFGVVCKHLKHEWNNCQAEDYALRMKEYERERRLLERAKRKGELRKENN